MEITPDPPPGPRPGSGTPRRHGRSVSRIAAVAVVTTAAAVVATGAFGPGAAPAAADGLRAFDDCTEVRDWFVDALRPLVGPYGFGGDAIAYATDSAGGTERVAAEAAPASDGAASAVVGTGATGTNLQEAGVDEPDLMKTADGLLLTTVGDRLVVLDVTDGAPREVGSLPVDGLVTAWGWGGPWGGTEQDVVARPGTAELLLDGDRVVLLSSGWAAAEGQEIPVDVQRSTWPGPVGSPTTMTSVVDVSDPSTPRLVSQQEVTGTLVGARLSQGVVRVVTSSTPTLPPADAEPRILPNDGIAPSWETEATAANLLALEQMAGEDFLPTLVERDDEGVVTTSTPAVSCADLAHPASGAGGGTVLVRSLDLGREDDPVVGSTAVAADGDLVYASVDRLYVATTQGGWGRWTGGLAVDDAGEITTELHGFATDEGAATTYVASGEVDGFLLGRWAMSARDGRLRVATTTGQVWGPTDGQGASESFVTVLAEREGELVTEGQVGGLGVGETIRAVRWFDAVATVVTFRQTDPLYVVDLSDPAAPTVSGELKVPGYSAYLHPVGDGRLVGVGQDATDEGRTTGVLVRTFDVSDPAAPTQVDTWTEEDTWTSVEYDSRQFSFLPEQRIVIMPMDTTTGSAVQAFSVDEAGGITAAGSYRPAPQQQWVSVLRAMPVGDSVAVLSSGEQGGLVTLLDLDGLAATGSVSLD